ncbi:MAG: rod shape-determining protein MreC [Fimbriimonadaceae bacterium]|nr:rod shape-determining protein MreC [Fimbriimonadaceae bacterium]
MISASFLGRVQTDARNAHRVDPISSFVVSLVSLPGTPILRAANAVEDFFGGVFEVNRLRAEVRRLKAQELQWSLYAERVDDLVSHVDYLRRLQNLPAVGGRTSVPALVIGFAPHEHRMTLSVGTRDGVAPDLAVVTPEGLLGVVQSVEATRCQIRLISSPQFRVGTIVLRTPPLDGIAKGEGRDVMVVELTDLSQKVDLNDVIVTSGYSEAIPRGIPVGKVIQVESNPEFGLRRLRVFPGVRISDVREVAVIR